MGFFFRGRGSATSKSVLSLSDFRVLFDGRAHRFEIGRSTAAVFACSGFLARASVGLFLKQGLIGAAAAYVALGVCGSRSVSEVLASAFGYLRRAQFSYYLRCFYFLSRLFFFLLNFEGGFFRFKFLHFRILLSFVRILVAILCLLTLYFFYYGVFLCTFLTGFSFR